MSKKVTTADNIKIACLDGEVIDLKSDGDKFKLYSYISDMNSERRFRLTDFNRSTSTFIYKEITKREILIYELKHRMIIPVNILRTTAPHLLPNDYDNLEEAIETIVESDVYKQWTKEFLKSQA